MITIDRPLITSSKIEVKQSPLHGWGVFAIEDIEADEILDECVFIPCKSLYTLNIPLSSPYRFIPKDDNRSEDPVYEKSESLSISLTLFGRPVKVFIASAIPSKSSFSS